MKANIFALFSPLAAIVTSALFPASSVSVVAVGVPNPAAAPCGPAGISKAKLKIFDVLSPLAVTSTEGFPPAAPAVAVAVGVPNPAAAPVSPFAPFGIVNFSSASELLPVFSTLASVPASPVTAVTLLICPAAPRYRFFAAPHSPPRLFGRSW